MGRCGLQIKLWSPFKEMSTEIMHIAHCSSLSNVAYTSYAFLYSVVILVTKKHYVEKLFFDDGPFHEIINFNHQVVEQIK